MIAQLIFGCVLSGAAGFLAGWWRGRSDYGEDLQPDLDKLRDIIMAARTDCETCGALYQARCPKGCPASPVSSDPKVKP